MSMLPITNRSTSPVPLTSVGKLPMDASRMHTAQIKGKIQGPRTTLELYMYIHTYILIAGRPTDNSLGHINRRN